MNLHGIAAAVQSIRRPGLLIPHLHVASMRHLDWHRIYASGVRYIVFDKDNCLTAPHHDNWRSRSKRRGKNVVVYLDQKIYCLSAIQQDLTLIRRL